jgi:hypothetical protein
MARACGTHGRIGNAYKILIGKPKGKRPFGRPRFRWEDNIKIYLREVGFVDVDRIHQAQDRDWWQDLVNMIMNLQVP